MRRGPTSTFMSFIGGRLNVAPIPAVFIRLKPREERSRGRVIQELRPKLATVPGIRAFPQIFPRSGSAGRSRSQSPVHPAGRRDGGALPLGP